MVWPKVPNTEIFPSKSCLSGSPTGTMLMNTPAKAGGHGFDPWFGKIPYAKEQLSRWPTTTVVYRPGAVTTEAHARLKAWALQRNSPPREGRTPLEGSPSSLQSEEARSTGTSSAAINKYIEACLYPQWQQDLGRKLSCLAPLWRHTLTCCTWRRTAVKAHSQEPEDAALWPQVPHQTAGKRSWCQRGTPCYQLWLEKKGAMEKVTEELKRRFSANAFDDAEADQMKHGWLE